MLRDKALRGSDLPRGRRRSSVPTLRPETFLVRRNLDYRASRDTVEERTVEESFATPVLASFPILAEEKGRFLIDAVTSSSRTSSTCGAIAPGNDVARHTPDPRALTLREHHSFVELPDDNYRPRAFDPRVGMFSVDFFDFSRPFNVRPQERWIAVAQ